MNHTYVSGCLLLIVFKYWHFASVPRSVGRSVGLQNEIYLDETHGSKHLGEKC